MIFSFNLKAATFNCHGIGSSIDTIRNLTTEYQLVFLQETWLYPDDSSIVSRISEEYQSFSISSMSLDDNIIRGRPHGGMSVLWNKSLSNSIRTIQYDDNRILGIEVKSKDTILLFFISVFAI